MPCNVIVYETADRRSVAAAMAPLVAIGIVGNDPELQAVATEADQRLRRALTSVETNVAESDRKKRRRNWLALA